MSNTKINSEELILHYFNMSKRDTLSFEEIKSLRLEVENDNEYMFVDITYTSIRETITQYSNYLEIENSRINLIHQINFELEEPNVSLKRKIEELFSNK